MSAFEAEWVENPSVSEYFRRGYDYVLSKMNMPSDRYREQDRRFKGDELSSPAAYYGKLAQAGEMWDNRVSLDDIILAINSLPVGYKLRNDVIRGWTLGSIVAGLVDWAQGDRAVLDGLFFTGVTYDFSSFQMYDEPALRNPNDRESGYYTPISVHRQVHKVSIRYFPLDRVEVHGVGIAPASTSFEAYLDEIQETEGGSNMSCYMFWSDCSIARVGPGRQRNAVIRHTRRQRTAGLRNILLQECITSVELGDGVVYKLFIPSGEKNCFLQAVTWSILQDWLAHPERAAVSRSVEMVDNFLGCHNSAALVDEDLDEGLEMSMTTVEREVILPATRLAAYEETGSSAKKRQLEVKYGYSTAKMNRLSKILSSTFNYAPTLYYEKEAERLRNRLWSFYSGQSLTLFHLNDRGRIVSNERDACATGDKLVTSALTHTLAVYPQVPSYLLSRTHSHSVISAIESVSVPWFEKMHNAMNAMKLAHLPANSLTPSTYLDYVLYQQSRHESRISSTLIFNEPRREQEELEQVDDNSSEPVHYSTNFPLVCVFDLETVTNDENVQAHVYEPFRRTEQVDISVAEPIETQVPFSAQWVPVNLSDCGQHEELKRQKGVPLNTYDFTGDAQYDTLVEQALPGSSEAEVMADYVLGVPRVEYGDDVLGKCVEDMLLHIAYYAHSKGYRVVYMFSHNGTGFDNYVVLNFSRFQVKAILKTPRGLMGLTIAVPVDGVEHDILFKFRDTRLHVPGSLRDLCKGFGVPKAWCKLDFPIQKIHGGNCFKPTVKDVCEPYGINDVYSLSYILVKINKLIGDCNWRPASITRPDPPVCQFMTCMSMIRSSTRNHFLQYQGGLYKPMAVDVFALRTWINLATMGGRVEAYAKSYASPLWGVICDAYLQGSTAVLQSCHEHILADKQCMQVLDVTSLYPTAQCFCPMPIGDMYFLSAEGCEETIKIMECAACDELRTLCGLHKHTDHSGMGMRPFAFIIIQNMRPSDKMRSSADMRNMIGRKMLNGDGLLYSLETTDEVKERLGKEDVLGNYTCMTNVDLYWARRQGFDFEVICGFGFGVGMAYHSMIKPAFLQRIEAKKAGNKLLSNFLKLKYNGSFGVTAQNDIDEGATVISLPEELRNRSVLDEDVRRYVMKQSGNKILNASEYFTGESVLLRSGQTYVKKKKFEHVGELYAAQSPNHIGAAVLSYARHIMNLMMFNTPAIVQTYTDTDSDCVPEAVVDDLEKRGLINNSPDAMLGTMKNDHDENNGTKPRVVFSLFGAKKVKMHITLNAEGELRIFNTFKGFNPASFIDGRKMSPAFADKVVSRALLDIGLRGTCEPQLVTTWKKDLEGGVSITNHLQVMDTHTYLGHCKGTSIAKLDFGIIESLVPFGSTIEPHYPVSCEVTGPRVRDRIYSLPPSREENIDKIWGGCSYGMMRMLIDKYYGADVDNEYIPQFENDEERTEYMRILQVLAE